jgi:hypothetical protein
MKTFQLITIVAAIAVVIALLILLPNDAQLLRAQRAVPTAAPTPTEGPPPPLPTAFLQLLSRPLTEEQAVARAAEVDEILVLWAEPWSLETLQTQPDRISIEWHSDRGYDGDEYGPGAQMGPVWVITIKGQFRFVSDKPGTPYRDGITYTIAQNTGSYLGYLTGPFVE